MKKLLLLALLAIAAAAHAQSTAAKKELVAKVLQLQQPAIEAMARNLAERPAAQLSQGANVVLRQRVPPEKREAVARDINNEMRKYLDEVVPLVRTSALRAAPGTIGVLLEERFSEDELRQVISILESPVFRKFIQTDGEMQRALTERLAQELRTQLDARVRALDLAIAGHLGLPVSAPAAPPSGGAARPPARAASN